MKEIQDLRNHVDDRFDNLENKLDNHLERLSKAEEAIYWLKGHVKLSTTFILTLVTGLAIAYFQIKGA